MFLFKCIEDIQKFDIFVWLLLFCCFTLSLEAYIHPEYRQGGRLEGIGTPDSTDANLVATVLLVSVPFLLNKILFSTILQRGIALAFSVFILNAIVLCSSRGSLVGLACIALVYFAFAKDNKTRKKLILGSLIGGIVFFKLMDPTFIARIMPGEENQDTTGSGRTEIWGYGLDMIRDHPLGAGGGGFQILSPHYMPESLLTEGVRASHNTYLLVLAEQGLIGLGLFGIFCLSTIRMLHVIRKEVSLQKPEIENRLYLISVNSLAVEAAFIGVLTSGFFVDRLYFEMLYWLSAMAASLYFMNEKLLATSDDFYN